MTTKQHDIFISYSRNNAKIMRKVRDALRAGGAVIWTDEYLKPHTPEWESAIEQAIGESRGLVIICSPESKNSKWVRIELKWADIKGLDIFPFLISGTEETSIPTSLITHQYIDAREDTIGKIPILVDSVKERFGIIGIEELQAEIRYLTAQLNIERQRVTDLTAQLEQASHTTDDNSAVRDEVRQAKATITHLQTELQAQTVQINNLTWQLDEQTIRANMIQRQYNEQLEEAQGAIINLESRLTEQTNRTDTIQRQYDEKLKATIRLQTELQNQTSQLDEQSNRASTIQGQYNEQSETITSLENQLKSAKNTIGDLQNQLANVTTQIQPLKASNPCHWLVLLWWILVTPQKIEFYRKQYGYEKHISDKTCNYSGLEPIGNWLFSTLLWLPFAISLSAVSLGFTPTFSQHIPHHIPPILFGVVIVLWFGIGLFGKQLDDSIDPDFVIDIGIVSAIGGAIGIGVAGTVVAVVLAVVLCVIGFVSFVVGVVGGGFVGLVSVFIVSVIVGGIVSIVIIFLAGYLVNTKWGGKLILVVLPASYAFLIWVYYFGGWRVLMPVAS